MTKLEDFEAFNHGFEEVWSEGYVADLMPPEHHQSTESNWGKCMLLYTLLPLDGRHQDAKYSIGLEFHTTSTGQQVVVDHKVASMTTEFETFSRAGFVIFFAKNSDGEEILKLWCDNDIIADKIGDVGEFKSITVTLKYQDSLLEAQADQYDSLADARNRFVEYIHDRNEGLGWDLDPEAIFDPDSDGLSEKG